MTDLDKEWPSHAEELGRKSLDVLGNAIDRFDRGKITLRELYLVAGALWDAGSGLMPKEDLRVIEAAHKECIKEAKRRKKAR